MNKLVFHFQNINVMGGLTYELFNSIPKSVELAEPMAGNGAIEGILLNSIRYI